VCEGLFFVELFIFVLMAITMVCYHVYRKKADIEIASRGFYIVFVFLMFWVVARIVYMTDAFYNYSFTELAVIATLPCIFTYITIATSIYNIMHLC